MDGQTAVVTGASRDPADADLVFWAATDGPAEDLDGGGVGLREFRKATP